ncbi:MAG: antibiotic biosynthesis monooxygenase [Hyphomicrobiales bacterium]|nr:antibiotic biosynthesis monooxygenase [Hyphomicrobiales bacterium]
MSSTKRSGAGSVTVLITRRVQSGREDDFEALAAALIEAASRFPGHLGGYVLRPEGDASPLRQTLFAFDDQPHLDAWTASEERAALVAKLGEISEGEGAVHSLSGLEGWFALPEAPTRKPPPRPKMALVTWMGIFPLVFLLSKTVSPLFAGFPSVVGILVVTFLVTVAMTWVVMPFLVRLMAPWLYPDLRKKG